MRRRLLKACSREESALLKAAVRRLCQSQVDVTRNILDMLAVCRHGEMQGWVEGQQDGLQKGIGIGTCLHLSLSLRRTVILVPALHYQEVCPEFGWCS